MGGFVETTYGGFAMALSRKRQKELNRLKGQAEDLWEDQKELLDHASRVVREASRQAANYTREEVAPRVRDTVQHTYEDKLRPAVGAVGSTARSAALNTRDKLVDDVLPAMSSALGTALAAIEVAKNKQVREAIARASRFGTDIGTKVGIIEPPKKSGPGKYILIGFGVVTVAAIAYAAWQTLRADDDLWIDDEPETPQAN
jgi:polyribonucleotide nucleotidyltransferase